VAEAVSVQLAAPPIQEHALEPAMVPVTPMRESSTEIVSEPPREIVPVHPEPARRVAEFDVSPAAPTLPRFELPPDLVQGETAPGKAGQTSEAEPPAASTPLGERPRRPRPPEESIPSEPLVQIETRH